MTAAISLITAREVDPGAVEDVRRQLAYLAPGCLVLDMSQASEGTSVLAGQRLLRLTVSQFPAGSVFVVLVEPSRPIALRSAGYAFVGPNNGLFTPWLPADQVVEVAGDEGWEPYARTAAWLAQGAEVGTLGRTLENPVAVVRPAPSLLPDGWLQGEILYGDHFGNLVTNIANVRGGLARFRDHVLPVRATYSSAVAGELLALVSSEGELEIVLRDGSAAERLHAQPGEPVLWQPA